MIRLISAGSVTSDGRRALTTDHPATAAARMREAGQRDETGAHRRRLTDGLRASATPSTSHTSTKTARPTCTLMIQSAMELMVG